MAGIGRRMNSAQDLPKPLIDVNGKTMIERVVSTLNIPGHYIFIFLKGKNREYNLRLLSILNSIDTEKTTIIELEDLTRGPACTALKAKDLIDNDTKLIVANCDQIMNWNSSKFLEEVNTKELDGAVVTFSSNTPKNSYVKVNESGNAIKFAEKEVISNNSLNGIHFWSKGSSFVESVEEMIKDNFTINNEFYIAPSYNYLVKKGYRIKNFPVKEGEHYSVGTDEDLRHYLER